MTQMGRGSPRPDPRPVPVGLRLGPGNVVELFYPGLCRARAHEHRSRFEGEQSAVVQAQIDIKLLHCMIQAHAVVDDNFRIQTGNGHVLDIILCRITLPDTESPIPPPAE